MACSLLSIEEREHDHAPAIVSEKCLSILSFVETFRVVFLLFWIKLRKMVAIPLYVATFVFWLSMFMIMKVYCNVVEARVVHDNLLVGGLVPGISSVPSLVKSSFPYVMQAEVRYVRGRLNATHVLDLETGMRNSIARVEHLQRRIDSSRPEFGSDLLLEATTHAQYLWYGMELQIGSPAQDTVFLLLDTGSSLTWTQCQPCPYCYQQKDQLFSPDRSSTYHKVLCEDSVCSGFLDKTEVDHSCVAGICRYSMKFIDHTHSKGEVAKETFTFEKGGNSLTDVLFGCGLDSNVSTGDTYDGIVGLDASALSLASQVGGRFSQCFVPFGSAVTSTPIVFRDPLLPMDLPVSNVTTIPIFRNPHIMQLQLYYVKLRGIKINGELLDIPPDAFTLDGIGQGGVILDTGTTFSTWHHAIYDPLMNKLVDLRGSFSRQGQSLTSCWPAESGGLRNMNMPKITFVFDEGEMMLGYSASYVQENDAVCWAMNKMSDLDMNLMNVIGNWQMSNQFMMFDQQALNLGFAPYDCSNLT